MSEMFSKTEKSETVGGTVETLTADGIERLLPDRLRGMRIFVYGETDSTNSEAKRLIAAEKAGTMALVCADRQTAGRGRLGRTFYSPANTGLYMSFVLRTDAEFTDAVSLTTMAAVAVARAIEELTPLHPQIKWVNDLYIDGRKVCGILTEAVGDPHGEENYIIIGIGVNISTATFPEELSGRAASLGVSVARNALAGAITAKLAAYAANLSDRSYIEDYRSRSLVIGKEITFTRDGKMRQARAVGVDDRGGLMIETPNGTAETLTSGEITVRLSGTEEKRQ